MITVVARHQVKAECMEQALEWMRELVAATRREEGCISYEVHQDIKQPTILTMLEEWQSEAALAEHMKTPHFTRLVPLLGPLMESETDVNVYQKLI